MGFFCTEKVKKGSGSEQASNDIYIIYLLKTESLDNAILAF